MLVSWLLCPTTEARSDPQRRDSGRGKMTCQCLIRSVAVAGLLFDGLVLGFAPGPSSFKVRPSQAGVGKRRWIIMSAVDKKLALPFAAAPLGVEKGTNRRQKPEVEKGPAYFELDDEAAPTVPERLDGDLLGDGGVFKTILRAGDGAVVTPGSEVIVRYEGKTKDGVVLCRGDSYRFLQGDGTTISGWETAVGSMRVGEVAKVDIKPWYAYGSGGVPPIVGPDTPLEFEIEVLDASGNFMNPKNFRDIDPKKLRDLGAISTDYQERSEIRMRNMEGKGTLEKATDWFKSLYFFGFFEGETGQRAPWWLTPTITFPIMFATVGLAFYVLITNGGVNVKRDLPIEDQIEVGFAFLDRVFG